MCAFVIRCSNQCILYTTAYYHFPFYGSFNMQTQLYTSFVYFMCKLMGKRIAYHYIFNYECAKNSFFPFIFTSKEFINAIMTFFSKIIEEKSQNSCTAIDSKLTKRLIISWWIETFSQNVYTFLFIRKIAFFWNIMQVYTELFGLI